ncbi:integrase core domain-containing protein [Alkaliphilus metalliredigens]|uniref:integrase core domain-containing protein n=1 Tax=Alkaliphilus metalliredigens TaxID=208226 RepID=UPI0005A27146|nr:integrase core domain-containing protein [Alkaliphilus metalliredigens]
MSGKLSRTVLRRGRGSNPFSLVEFTSLSYIDLIKSYKTSKISMDGKGRATDNIAIERIFRSYKWERLYLLYPETVAEVKAMTKEYITKYPYKRGHQSYDYKTPSEVYYSHQMLEA